MAFQVSRRHTDVPTIQQGLDQREDLCAASPSGPAGVKVKPLRGTSRDPYHYSYLTRCFKTFLTVFVLISDGSGGVFYILMFDYQ